MHAWVEQGQVWASASPLYVPVRLTGFERSETRVTSLVFVEGCNTPLVAFAARERAHSHAFAREMIHVCSIRKGCSPVKNGTAVAHDSGVCSELRAGATPGALLLARPTPDGSRVSLWESERVCAAIGHAELPGWTRRAPKQLS